MNTRKTGIICLCILLMVLAILPLIVHDTQFQHVLIMVMLFATLSQAWNILGGYAGQVSFGHACFFGIGAYAAIGLLKNVGLIFWGGALIGVFVSVGLAILIGSPVFKLRGDYFAISTLAIAEVVRELFGSWKWIDGVIGLDAPLVEPSLGTFIFYKTKLPYHYFILLLLVAVMITAFLIERSRMGYYFKAINQNAEAAETYGVNTSRYKLYSLIISVAFTAVCGSFYAQYVLHIEPDTVMSVPISIKIVLVTILGGVGTMWGPIIGAAILIPLAEYSRIWLGGTGQGIDLIIFGIVIMLMIIYRPKGIAGMLEKIISRFEG
jgi:branched-chain amino acid transport system permease protein